MSDNSAFRQRDYELVFGTHPECIMRDCHTMAVENHHILGRGYKYGIRPRTMQRHMFSSVFNCAPLCHQCHKRGNLHRPDVQRLLLMHTSFLATQAMYIGNSRDEVFKRKFKHRYDGTFPQDNEE